MPTNKISNTNQILLVVNTIALIFFIFSDEIITSIKWSDEGISVGDIATVISAIIMGITAIIMLWANKTAKESVEISKKTTEAQLLIDLKKEYNLAKNRQDQFDILDRMSLFYNNRSISKEFAQNFFLFYLIHDVTAEIDSDFEWNCYKELLTTYKKWIPDYKDKYSDILEFEDPNIKYRATTTHEVSLDNCLKTVTDIIKDLKI